jgi:enoyl-CoA hydratase
MSSEDSPRAVMKFEARDGLAFLRIDDGKANAIQPRWCADMNRALDRTEESDSSALIITGRPGFLSAGLDLKVFPSLQGGELTDATGQFVSTMKRLFLFPKPLIVASTGHAIAGGMMLLLTADYRLALDDDRFRYGLNEAVTGIPLLGGTVGICQHGIPVQHQTEMILQGRLLTARQCYEREVIHELVPNPEALIESAIARAMDWRDLHLATYAVNKLILRREIFDNAVRVAESLISEAPISDVFANIKR